MINGESLVETTVYEKKTWVQRWRREEIVKLRLIQYRLYIQAEVKCF